MVLWMFWKQDAPRRKGGAFGGGEREAPSGDGEREALSGDGEREALFGGGEREAPSGDGEREVISRTFRKTNQTLRLPQGLLFNVLMTNQ